MDIEPFLARIAGLSQAQRAFDSPYAAGRDAAINGPNPANCHYAWFSSPERTAEWERSKSSAVQP